jgi:WXG100 family type VII secretion target
MPDFSVNSDQTAQTSAALLADFSDLQAKLNDVRNKVQALLTDGFQTPAAQQAFQQRFDEFSQGFQQVNDSLEQIGQQLRAVGETFEQADQTAAGLFQA